MEQCFAIYYAKNINLSNFEEKLVIELPSTKLFFWISPKKYIQEICQELIKRMEFNSDVDIEIGDIECYLVGMKTLDSIILIFTKENNPHNYLKILCKHILLIDPKNLPNNISEIFSLIKTEMKMKKIQEDTENVKRKLYDTVESLLERGEHLEDLLEKTENLKKASGTFLNKTKKSNCCVLF